ncbi:MAG: type II toxin-antitoxin system RelB/DinJ family antitoxin [Burkholderiales bacterium]|jgi:DNA-damage-inducible protein J|nr:type II toxin-antitoxin system RelB/DinJ family antitoxin [Burkholderiales bacterium]
MATLQVRVEDSTKSAADALFADLGLDTSTAVRMFLAAALLHRGLPFPVTQTPCMSAELAEAVEDARLRRNLSKPYKTAKEAINAALDG